MNKKILIIEDEKALAKNLAMALEDKYQVLLAETGRDGIAQAIAEKPDLILLDVMLPDTTGFEVLKELQANKKTEDINVIISTNLGDPVTVSKILEAGGKDYIVKTDWKISDLVKKIDEAVRR